MYVLSHVVILVGVTFAATHPPGTIEQDADPTEVMEQARELAKNGQHEEALAKLLWCFDDGAKGNIAFTGVRLSFLLSRIVKLGKEYPPALDALRQRRDAAVTQAANSKGKSRYMQYLMDVVALNHNLGEDAANLVLYDELKSEVPESPILAYLRHYVADELVKAGRADEAREHTPASRMPAVSERAWPRDALEGQESGSARTTTVYSLDSVQYEQDLAATQDEVERLEVLKRRWNEVVLAATYCDVARNPSFHRSVRYWQSGLLCTGTWTVQSEGDLFTAHDASSKATVLVRGDCQGDVTVSAGEMVHIYGDLSSKLTISGQCEVVIAGDITGDGVIEADGILSVFVGGNVDGQISNRSSTTLWINGDLSGTVHAGHPATTVHVIGDFFGQLVPVDKASLAYLDVRGIMPLELIETTARYGWTEFKASIGTSDAAAGLYPKNPASNSHWVVHSQHR